MITCSTADYLIEENIVNRLNFDRKRYLTFYAEQCKSDECSLKRVFRISVRPFTSEM